MKTPAQLLPAALMGAIAMICLALSFVLAGDDPWAAPPSWALVAQLVAGVALFGLVEVVGYRVPALPAGIAEDAAREKGMQAWQTTMILRFALGESIFIASIVLAFLVPHGGLLVVLVGAAVSLLLLGVHVWPWSRPVEKIATGLDRDGGRSTLREDLGLRGPGPIQRL